MCKVSVILPVYNSEKYISDAIKSILSQTLSNFELIIIDDGSTDNSLALIREFDDDRIKLLLNNENKKLVWTLNRGLECARGEYIARMDADDISYPQRLKIQVEFLDQNPEVVVVGSNYRIFGQQQGTSDLPTTSEEIALALFFSNPIAHPTVMMRRNKLIENKLKYKIEYIHMEDICLWHELIKYGQFRNLKEILLDYRVEGQNISIANLDTHRHRNRNFYKFILKHIFVNVDDSLTGSHYAVTYARVESKSPRELSDYLNLLKSQLLKLFRKDLVEKQINKMKLEIAHKFADMSMVNGFKFAFFSRYFSWKIIRYIIAQGFNRIK